MSARRVMIVVNAEWYFYSHRLLLAQALRSAGFDVVVTAAVERNGVSAIEAAGLRFIPLSLRRRSWSIFRETRTLLELWRLYRRERPDIVHHVTIKPVIYGTIAARLAAIPCIVNTIPGLGYMFAGRSMMRWVRQTLAIAAYRLALGASHVHVIFENPDDQHVFISNRIVPPSQTILIRSAGVDTQRFTAAPEPEGVPVIMFAARLLWDKGVAEVVEAARRLRTRGVSCRVVLVGMPDTENPNAVPERELVRWRAEGIIEWWGQQSDMPAALRQSAIVVLPSRYREGIPMILLEGAAMGRPLVATDVPGCREAVQDGVNGFLVPAGDVTALVQALEKLLADPALRAEMGARGRALVVSEFSATRVNGLTVDYFRALLRTPRPSAFAGVNPAR